MLGDNESTDAEGVIAKFIAKHLPRFKPKTEITTHTAVVSKTTETTQSVVNSRPQIIQKCPKSAI